ncbi:hypothetical protein BH11BAC1_BH11BAC1_09280 [soil metagenome]
MKKVLPLIIGIYLVFIGLVKAQCTGSTFYDLTVTDTTVFHPIGNSFNSAIICSGGVLIDSANCCTRVIHILPGGDYEAGGLAYGIVYVMNGGTFNAHGCTGFFGCYYETGATILNYPGPLSLCPSISFTASSCITGIIESKESVLKVYPNPANDILHFENVNAHSIIAVYNFMGQLVLKSEIKSNVDALTISSLNNGLFSYSIYENNKLLGFGKFAIVR